MISMIACIDSKHGIGSNNQLPWHLPEDLRYFRRVTEGHPIVMGRKTYESIGKPLPNRTNFVLSRNPQFLTPSSVIITEPSTILSRFFGKESPEVFIIGGSSIYEYFLPYAEKLYLTELEETFDCDAYFPSFSLSEWKNIKKEKGKECDEFDYYFSIYTRRHVK